MEIIPRSCFCESVKNELLKSCKCLTRSRRSDYFSFMLVVWGTCLPIFITCLTSNSEDDSIAPFYWMMFSIMALIYFTISATIRRLHDIGKSGCYLWLALFFTPSIIVFIIFCFYDSEKESNNWGPSPKYKINKPQYEGTSNDIYTYTEPNVIVLTQPIIINRLDVPHNNPNPQFVNAIPIFAQSSNVYYVPPQIPEEQTQN